MPAARPARVTRSPRPGDIVPRWWVVDAADQTLGRLASRIAGRLRGKHAKLYVPHADAGDFVVVVNAAKVRLTGRKREDKIYYRHSGHAGALRSRTAGEILDGPHPERLVEQAVRGMLPKNALGRKLYRKLKVYAGPGHPHAAQKPEELTFA
jgi:large subunit ribosomal protein L13